MKTVRTMRTLTREQAAAALACPSLVPGIVRPFGDGFVLISNRTVGNVAHLAHAPKTSRVVKVG